VSLVGFLFQNTRLKSVPIPFHRTFEEVNLRFYVQHTKSTGERRRGVVFISELVPRFALSLVANTIYGENYSAVPVRHDWEENGEQRSVRYQWRYKSRWNELQVNAAVHPKPIVANSAEEFFTEHYWGYTKRGTWTSEYEVLHPRWMIYPVLKHSIDVDFGALYGSGFASLATRTPESILLAEGSKIEVRSGERIAAAG
jgi:uncharacterized protein YqjF (DUF2071 family)